MLRNIKKIILLGTLAWGISFAILSVLYRYYIQELCNPYFWDSLFVHVSISLIGGTIVGYFSVNKKPLTNK